MGSVDTPTSDEDPDDDGWDGDWEPAKPSDEE